MKMLHRTLSLSFAAAALTLSSPAQQSGSAAGDSSLNIRPYGRMQLMGFGQSLTDNLRADQRMYLYLKEARFGLLANAGDTKFDAQVAFGGEDIVVAPTPGVSLQLLDFDVDMPLSNSLRLKAGQFKVPYGREGLTNSGFLSFGDRSILYNAFVLGRDVGVAAYGSWGNFDGAVGVFTGGGRDIPIRYLPEHLGLPMLVLRAGVNTGYDEDVFTVRQTENNPPLGAALYINAMYTKDSRIGHSTVLNIKSTDKSLLIDGNWNPYIGAEPLDRGEYWQAGTDAATRGVLTEDWLAFGEAELDFGGYKNVYGSLSSAGARLQVGVAQKPYEIALRGAFIKPDSKFAYVSAGDQAYPIVDDKPIYEITLGVTYFIQGDRLKLNADLPILLKMPVMQDQNSGAYILTQQPDQVSFLASGATVSRQNIVQGRLQLQYAF
jgi:hypothetical protein